MGRSRTLEPAPGGADGIDRGRWARCPPASSGCGPASQGCSLLASRREESASLATHFVTDRAVMGLPPDWDGERPVIWPCIPLVLPSSSASPATSTCPARWLTSLRHRGHPQGWAAARPPEAVAPDADLERAASQPAADGAERVEHRATPAPARSRARGFYQPDGLEERELERAAVGAGPPQRPAPFAAESACVAADVTANLPVALVGSEDRVKLMTGAVAVTGIRPTSAPGAVERPPAAQHQTEQRHRSPSGPPAVALGPVELQPPVAVGVAET